MFDRAVYLRYLASPEWAAKRREAQEYYHWRCAVCGNDYRRRGDHIEVHHLPQGYDHLGHESVSLDLRLLCGTHHLKGRITAEAIRTWRHSYLFFKCLSWLFLLPFRLLWLLARMVKTAAARAQRCRARRSALRAGRRGGGSA